MARNHRILHMPMEWMKALCWPNSITVLFPHPCQVSTCFNFVSAIVTACFMDWPLTEAMDSEQLQYLQCMWYEEQTYWNCIGAKTKSCVYKNS
jgi:hypothetical protein